MHLNMLRPGSFALTALLALLAGIGPLSVDMYLASWPEMVRLLGASSAQVQLTISVYLIGFGTGQAIYGPVSDRHGRKPVLLAAARAVRCGERAVCCGAPSIEVLIVARFLQAHRRRRRAGAAARDRARPLRRRHMSRASCRTAWRPVMALTPVVAPLIGGVLQTAFGWRSNFVALTAFGLMLAGAGVALLQESLRVRARRSRSRRCRSCAPAGSFLRQRLLRRPSRPR